MSSAKESFPRQEARTQRFSLGRPRSFTVAPDGSRVVFLRSAAGDDPVNALWVLDVEGGAERLVYHPSGAGGGHLSAEELALRERARERGGGVVAYSTDRAVTTTAFSVGGKLHVADLSGGGARELPSAAEPVFDPQLDPTGRSVGYVSCRVLRVTELDGRDRVLAEDPDPDVSWGLAEFVAAEEMGRHRGFWWSPDGTRIVAARVDERPVEVRYLFDPIDPQTEPRAVRYPGAGTANAEVTLHIQGFDGSSTEVRWDRAAFEYLARVSWDQGEPLTLLVQSRDQRTTRVLTASDDGHTTVVREDTDDAWVELVRGSPAWTADGRLVCTTDLDDTRRLVVGGEPVTPPGVQVHRILHAGDDVLFTASEDPTEEHVWRWSPSGRLERLTEAPGVHDAAAGGEVLVVTTSTIDEAPTVTVRRSGEHVATVASNAEHPVVEPKPRLFAGGARDLRSALLLPEGREPDEPIPVLLDPYGGPWFQRVMKVRGEYLVSQWFADQGFAVLVIDGRGTPSRGPGWERAVHLDLLGPVLEDQVDGLHAAADRYPFLDLDRVAIRGWSFGGELSAAAVLRRPDVFHAAVVGAPVTDQRLYDTHYNERYLGHPDREPESYRRNSVLEDAAKLERPMLLIHGLADDNCYVANSLRLSRALTAAGRPHTFLPLSGQTHMVTDIDSAENLLLLQLRFLREALGL
ncbi:MAG: prolyl oligopeptidase family serine peptidase [Actinomycetota bacterium]